MRWWSVGFVVVHAVGCAQILDFDEDYLPVDPPADTSAGVGGTGTLASSATSSSNTGTAQGGASPAAATSSSSAGAGGAGMTYTWDAQTATMNSNGTFALPPWLAFTSPSAGKTSQTGSSSLRTGFGVNAPRARRVTDQQADWGLSIESERTNVVHGSDSWDNYWQYPDISITMVFSITQADPAGGLAATIFSSTGNKESNYFTATGRTVSAWLRGSGLIGDPDPPGGPMSFAHFHHVEAVGAPYVEVDSMIWTRYSFTNSMNATGNIALDTRDSPPGAGAIPSTTEVLAYGAQVEPDHAYPSSYIPNNTLGSVTRQAEILWSPLASMLVSGGFFNIELHFAPNYASGEQAGDHTLIFFKDIDNHLFVRKTDNAIVLRMNGSDLASSALQWSREQPLTVIARHTPTGSALTVMGAGNGDGTVSQMAGAPVQVDTTLIILGNGTGAQECADLRYISFAPP